MKFFLIFIVGVFAEETSGDGSGDGKVERDSLTDDVDYAVSDRSSLVEKINELEKQNDLKDKEIADLKDDLKHMTAEKNVSSLDCYFWPVIY